VLSVDFHTHTFASHDSVSTPEPFIRVARRRKLDRVVVTDHNTITGAQVLQALAPDLIIVGEEIMTTQGEILGIFVTREVPGGLDPQETIRRLRDQGAFISVSHPFDHFRSGAWELEPLMEILSLVDAIETFNARCMLPGANHRAADFAVKNSLAGTAGSDAHAPIELGAARMLLPDFSTPEELREVIHLGRLAARRSTFWVHFISRYAHWRKKVV
jgi:predicted metal-dependent phosphoesterase TrpH